MNKNITPLPWNFHRYHVQEEPTVFEHEETTMTSWEAVIAKGDKVLGRFSMTAPTKGFGWETVGTIREAKANAEYVIEACNAYPALTARVKELEEENARLRSDFGKIFVSFLQDDRDGVGEIFTGVYTLDFTTGEPVFADSALNKEPTT